MQQRRAFTLIELIIVIAIIAIIAATVFVAIDPGKQLHKARNSTRWADITSILEGIKKYQFENDGVLPPMDSDPSTVQIIGLSVSDCTCTGQSVGGNCGLDLTDQLRPYMKEIPTDPLSGTPRNTNYYINKDEYGLVSVGACDPEGEGPGGEGEVPVIEVTR